MFKLEQQGPDKILSIDVNFFNLKSIFKFIKFVSDSLDRLTSHHTLLGLIMALGIGCGIGITIFSRPDISLAHTYQLKEKHKIISVSTENFLTSIKHGRVASLSQLKHQLIVPFFSGSINSQNQAFILLSSAKMIPLFQQLSLGDNITLNFDNNSFQNRQVVEIKTIKKEQIQRLVPQKQATVIICAPKKNFSLEYFCLITR